MLVLSIILQLLHLLVISGRGLDFIRLANFSSKESIFTRASGRASIFTTRQWLHPGEEPLASIFGVTLDQLFQAAEDSELGPVETVSAIADARRLAEELRGDRQQLKGIKRDTDRATGRCSRRIPRIS